MLLIFSSKLVGRNQAVDDIAKKLEKEDVRCKIINPHDFLNNDYSLLQFKDKISFRIKEEEINPSVIYMASAWRCDSIINIPKSIKFPNAYRMRVAQFMQDIRFAFEDALWIPGKYERIERGESKPFVIKSARMSGLDTPLYTCDSKFNSSLGKLSENLYRKNLGYPFVISYNREKSVEVGVTTTNVTHNNKWLTDDAGSQPWQWQEPIHCVAQIRCFCIGDKIWSVRWDTGLETKKCFDYRHANQIKKEGVVWSKHELPPSVAIPLVEFMKKLSLTISSPEFLLLKDGRYIFIDLNPVGDWFGFFPDDVNEEIISNFIAFFKKHLLLQQGSLV